MKSLTAENNYSAAAEIADTINWHKIKNVNALMKAGEIYEKTGRYEESRDILLTAYDRSPIGRMIIYRLAEVAVKMGNYSEAQDYYQEFVEIAPHDNLKYVLKYEISKAQGADLNTQIGILEELKEQEYLEEWAFELACLYHKAGLSDKCIDACDELILWFGDGPYVERALELKMLYQPLTKQQEEKYREFRLKKEGVIEVRPDDELESGEIVSEPVQIPKVGLSPERFNTQNLQEELQRSMQQIMEATEKEVVDDSMDTIKKLVEDIPYLQIPKEEPLPEDTAELPHIETDAEIDDSLKNNFKELLAEDYDGQMSLFVPDKGTAEPQITGQMSIDEVLAEWERTKRAAETALQEAEQRKLQSAKARALQEAGDIMERLADVIPKLDSGFTPKDLLEEQYLGGQPIADDAAVEMVANMNQLLQQEIDRLSTENARMDEQLAAVEAARTSGADIAAYEAAFAVGEAARLTEPEVEALLGAGVQELQPQEPEYEQEMEEQTGLEAFLRADVTSMMGGIQEPGVMGAEELEESPGADAASTMGEEESLGAEVALMMGEEESSGADAASAMEEEAFPGAAAASMLEEEASLGAAASALEEEASLGAAAASMMGSMQKPEPGISGNAAEVLAATEDTAALSGEPEEESEEIESALGASIAALLGDDETEKAAAQHTKKIPAAKLPEIEEPEADGHHVITRLSKEQREIFTYFVPIKGMEQQLCQAMTGAAERLASGGRASTGNMIIQGGQGSGKTVLATSMIKALQKETGKPNGRIGKIEASVLNQKDAAALLKKVAGGCLIIEKVGGISKETAVKLGVLLESDTSGLLVIIEDTRRGIEKALGRDAGFAARFSEKITIPIFTSDELVAFAKAYARELGYTIDDMGVLALYNSISNIQKLDEATTLTEVKDIVDGAIAHAERGGLKKAFSIIASRRYDEDDYVILHEKDFGF